MLYCIVEVMMNTGQSYRLNGHWKIDWRFSRSCLAIPGQMEQG